MSLRILVKHVAGAGKSVRSKPTQGCEGHQVALTPGETRDGGRGRGVSDRTEAEEMAAPRAEGNWQTIWTLPCHAVKTMRHHRR